MKKNNFLIGFLSGILLVIIFNATPGILRRITGMEGTGAVNSKTLDKLTTLDGLVGQTYLNDVDSSELEEDIYKGYIAALGDNYAYYYTADEYSQETATNDGSYVGIGVVMSLQSDGTIVVDSCYDSTGKEAGILPGDILISVEGQSTEDMTLSQVASTIRSCPNDSVVLVIERDGRQIEYKVELSDVEIPSVDYRMEKNKTGYIQITSFTGVTASQFTAALESLRAQNIQSLIVDLRDNPGGTLQGVCDTLRQILPEGLIVYTEDKDGNREEETCDGTNELDIPLVVLVNGGSASASEIFAGAVQDYGIGTIMGTTTFGKGIVQSIRKLSDGSAVKFTTAAYYTPKGNSLNGSGVTPDVVVEASETSGEDASAREAEASEDSAPQAETTEASAPEGEASEEPASEEGAKEDSAEEETDIQLQKALEYLVHRLIHN